MSNDNDYMKKLEEIRKFLDDLLEDDGGVSKLYEDDDQDIIHYKPGTSSEYLYLMDLITKLSMFRNVVVEDERLPLETRENAKIIYQHHFDYVKERLDILHKKEEKREAKEKRIKNFFHLK